MKEGNPERCRVTWFNLQHEREEEEEPLLRRIDEIKEMNNSLNREMYSFYLILSISSKSLTTASFNIWKTCSFTQIPSSLYVRE